ncbi:MAG: hypothetical protein BWY32_03862 [bacterium ADurb.Bin243]|nr:MAG: hypothetical protein BWY32_03862 [bacterium ADurb.Bin243]
MYFIYKARRASPSLNYSLSTLHYSLITYLIPNEKNLIFQGLVFCYHL